MKRVLVIGGYGNFGQFISRRLAKEDIQLIIAGRSLQKAQAFAAQIHAQAEALDIQSNFEARLRTLKPDIVIHTSGPFQSQGYTVAEACIACGAHYIDLADGREFVANIVSLERQAKQAGVLVISGASSVPCLTAALVDHYRADFQTLESLDYGITTAQRTTRGLATTAAILGYTGKPFKTLIAGTPHTVYGWQGLTARRYRGLGIRLLGNCNIPDLELFPLRYPGLKTVRFYAGLEIPCVHLTLWCLSWLVRARLVKSLEPAAPLLLRTSFLFDWLGSANSGFHLNLAGINHLGTRLTLKFELIARSGDGPYIPCMPAILLAQQLIADKFTKAGAMPCVGLISKDEYLAALSDLDINWTEQWCRQ